MTGTRGVVATLVATMVLSSLGTSVANVALPVLATDFGAPLGAVQWVVLAYLVTTTALVVPAGRIGDTAGRRRVLAAGVVVFALGCGLAAVAPWVWLLVAARAVQGAGGAVMLALTLALVRESVPADRVGSAMGLLGTASAVGTALGPSAGGLLVAGPGWRWIFGLLAPVAVLVAVALLRLVPSGVPAGRRPVPADRSGVVLLTATLVLYGLASTTPAPLLPAVAAVVALGAFVLVERRATAPVLDLRALRGQGLTTGMAANVAVATIMMTTLVVGPFQLSVALGLPLATTGVVMAVGPVVSMVTGAPAGRLVDRLGTGRPVVAGLVLMLAGVLVIAFVPRAAGVLGYLAGIVLLTPGYQLFQAANNTAVLTAAGAAEQGAASGALSLARNVGLISGASVTGLVFAAGAGTAEMATATAAAVQGGTRAAFGLAAGLAVVALALVSARARRHRPGRGRSADDLPSVSQSRTAAPTAEGSS